MTPTLQDEDRQVQVKGEVDSSLALNDTMAPSHEVYLGGVGVENGEHGIFPSPMEAHGDENIEPTPICLDDEMIPIPCEHESHLALLSESDSELSDSHPICEIECFHLEVMSDTPSSMDDEAPITEKKMYMVHKDDDITPCLQEDECVGHMDPTTSTTPTSNESDYKDNYIGVDDAMIPLVDMKINECMHDIDATIAMSHALNTSPSTEEVEDAMNVRGLKAEVVEAWKRRWKKLQAQLHWSLRPRQLTL
ncbi:hypothetical protein QYE76_035892 [Lolium multiflorum]|uniref:Uncharacterized protein n=1 Tax=Lolium multiflorum TaxID=4521 RepID=A0AAD8R2K2_LOLMU|nr:hypothetical protein QYE76_035892 [Lolium multiflorum]